MALCPLIQIKFNFARLLFYYQGFVLFHVSVVRNVFMLKMKLYFYSNYLIIFSFSFRNQSSTTRKETAQKFWRLKDNYASWYSAVKWLFALLPSLEPLPFYQNLNVAEKICRKRYLLQMAHSFQIFFFRPLKVLKYYLDWKVTFNQYASKWGFWCRYVAAQSLFFLVRRVKLWREKIKLSRSWLNVYYIFLFILRSFGKRHSQ